MHTSQLHDIENLNDVNELAEFIRVLENLGHSDLIEHVTKE